MVGCDGCGDSAYTGTAIGRYVYCAECIGDRPTSYQLQIAANSGAVESESITWLLNFARRALFDKQWCIISSNGIIIAQRKE